MARRRKNIVTLEAGFYIVNGAGCIRSQEVFRGKAGERTLVVEPIRFRTLGGAKDGLALAGEGHAILCVTVDNFAWGE